MKFFLISDNIDTQMGLRLAGVEGVVVHTKDEMLTVLNDVMNNPDIAVILMTTLALQLAPEIVYNRKLNTPRPLIVEIPDRHGSLRIGETIDSYISAAIGIKI